MDIRSATPRHSSIDTITFFLSGSTYDGAVLRRLEDEGWCKEGRSFRGRRRIRIQDQYQDYLDLYQTWVGGGWQVTAYPGRFVSKLDLDALLWLLFPDFERRGKKIVRLDLNCDLGARFSDVAAVTRVRKKQNNGCFANEATLIGNGLHFGARHKRLTIYDKSKKCSRTQEETALQLRDRLWSRVELRLEGKANLPIQDYQDLDQLLHYSPFEELTFNKVTILKDDPWVRRKRRLFERLHSFSTLCVSQSLTHAMRLMNRDRHLARLMGKFLFLEPIPLDLNGQWKKDFGKFIAVPEAA